MKLENFALKTIYFYEQTKKLTKWNANKMFGCLVLFMLVWMEMNIKVWLRRGAKVSDFKNIKTPKWHTYRLFYGKPDKFTLMSYLVKWNCNWMRFISIKSLLYRKQLLLSTYHNRVRVKIRSNVERKVIFLFHLFCCRRFVCH